MCVFFSVPSISLLITFVLFYDEATENNFEVCFSCAYSHGTTSENSCGKVAKRAGKLRFKSHLFFAVSSWSLWLLKGGLSDRMS